MPPNNLRKNRPAPVARDRARIAPILALAISIGGIALVGALDWTTGIQVSFSILYLLPIAFGTWHTGWKQGAALSLTGAVVWLEIDRLGGSIYSSEWIPYWNALVRFGFFILITHLLARVRLLARNLEILVKERTSALEREVAERKALEAEVADLHRREQERLAHELHDNLGAYLAGVAFRAKIISEALQRRNAPELPESEALVQLINTGIDKVRRIARLLMPIEPDNSDLESALFRLSAEVEKFFGVACALQAGPGLPELTSDQAEQLCRIAQEAVRNAIQHAPASAIEISLRVEGNLLSLTIENEGKPWDPSIAPSVRGLGLRIMKYRSERIGATLSITRGTASGTRVACRAPLEQTLRSLEPNVRETCAA